MAHLTSSSLRIPANSSTSSATHRPDDSRSTTTLRARLRSQEPPKPDPASPKHSLYPDVYQQFRAYFNNHVNQVKAVDVRNPVPDDRDAVTKLREAFARAGMALHASAMEKLILAHVEIQSKIDSFAETSSAALAQSDVLYSNIAYPLAATLCRDKTNPRATIAVHLSNLKQDLESTIKELEALEEEWEACAQTELKAWKALTEPKRVVRKVDAETEDMVIALKAEARDIVDEKCQVLTDIDKEYKAKIQTQMAKIMKQFVDDAM